MLPIFLIISNERIFRAIYRNYKWPKILYEEKYNFYICPVLKFCRLQDWISFRVRNSLFLIETLFEWRLRFQFYLMRFAIAFRKNSSMVVSLEKMVKIIPRLESAKFQKFQKKKRHFTLRRLLRLTSIWTPFRE